MALAGPAAAQIGSIILVTTTDDTQAADGFCSLREAIIASNTNSIADPTAGSCQGTGTDSIRFSLGSGTPRIDIASALPAVSATVTIRGNTGGATRVELRGPRPSVGGATFDGLDIQASNTAVRNLVIGSFWGRGIVVNAVSGVTIMGSYIGVAADGVTPMGNGGAGVVIADIQVALPGSHVIGGTGAGEANVIAHNDGSGVAVHGRIGNRIRGNSIHGNNGRGIENIVGGNLEIAPPVIVEADGQLAGTSSCASCVVDVYADGWDQGEAWLGATTADGAGNWTLAVPAPGPYITATLTDGASNTSEFSLSRRCPDFGADGLCDAVDDSDVDGVVDSQDNCLLAPNGPALPDAGGNSQRDSDSDQYGNDCDGDLNNSGGLVNATDLAIFRLAFGSANPHADFNGNGGLVNATDLAILRTQYGKPPGPSGPNRPCGIIPGAPGCGWQAGEMLTHSQERWGAAGDAAATLFTGFGSVYPAGYVEVGLVGTAGRSMVFTAPFWVQNYLPAYGASAPLVIDYLDPYTTSSGVFGGHVLALKLNVDFSDAGYLGGSQPLGDLRICGSELSSMNGSTVRDALAVASSLLGGGGGPIVVGEAAILVARINSAFILGLPSTFAQEQLVNGSCPEPGPVDQAGLATARRTSRR
jgi:CSLREA domain-containing protein